MTRRRCSFYRRLVARSRSSQRPAEPGWTGVCVGGATGVTEVTPWAAGTLNLGWPCWTREVTYAGPTPGRRSLLQTAGWIHKVQMVKITSESKSSAGWGQICETDLIAAEPDLVLIQLAHLDQLQYGPAAPERRYPARPRSVWPRPHLSPTPPILFANLAVPVPPTTPPLRAAPGQTETTDHRGN